MSISTASISSACSCSGSSEVHSTKAAAAENWRAEISGRCHWFPGQFDKFLDDLLPSSVPYEPMNDLTGAFSSFQPVKGKEVLSYDGLIAGLNQVVRDFGDKKLHFYNTHGTLMNFPFDEFRKPNSWTYPDICVSFPGSPIHQQKGTAL